ncbi:MAG: hypothetical protein FWE56_02825 [Candidatus Bathyarchaeota archaeon]|nr:hypothetical protein [Candidatus Termiticorpusculum sp.]MCL2868441.1 hypothetical protein [Candidatus Termiticorpusculum sp.]
MVHLTHGVRSLIRKRNVTKIMAIAIILILVFSSLYLAGSIFLRPPNQQPSTSENGDTLNIALNQTRDYTHKGTTYEFKYLPGKQLQISTKGKTPLIYAAITGTTYNPFNLKVTIYSANENQLIIYITPS